LRQVVTRSRHFGALRKLKRRPELVAGTGATGPAATSQGGRRLRCPRRLRRRTVGRAGSGLISAAARATAAALFLLIPSSAPPSKRSSDSSLTADSCAPSSCANGKSPGNSILAPADGLRARWLCKRLRRGEIAREVERRFNCEVAPYTTEISYADSALPTSRL
jgi:hypothetical protein